MTGIPSYSTTPANNVAAKTGITWDEGMSPALVNNSARQNMTDMRLQWNDASWFQYGAGSEITTTLPAYASGTSFTIAGIDVTAYWHAGRRVKAVGTSTGTIYGKISSSSFSTNTTVNVTWDSGSLSNETLAIYAGTQQVTGKPIAAESISGLGSGVATLLGGTSSGTGGPAGTASPTFTGTITAAALSATGNVTFTGNVSHNGDTTQLRVQNTATTSAIALATVKGWLGSGADVTNMAIGVTAGLNVYVNNSGTVALSAATSGSVSFPNGINSTNIGATTPGTGAFTTLSTTGALTYGGVTLTNGVNGTGRMVLATTTKLYGTTTIRDVGDTRDNFLMNTSGSQQWTQYGSGAATFDASGNITSVSDPRQKIILGGYENGLKEVEETATDEFMGWHKWRPESGMETEGTYASFFARDHFPIAGAVAKNGERPNSFNDRPVVMALVNAVAELSAQNKILADRITALEASSVKVAFTEKGGAE